MPKAKSDTIFIEAFLWLALFAAITFGQPDYQLPLSITFGDARYFLFADLPAAYAPAVLGLLLVGVLLGAIAALTFTIWWFCGLLGLVTGGFPDRPVDANRWNMIPALLCIYETEIFMSAASGHSTWAITDWLRMAGKVDNTDTYLLSTHIEAVINRAIDRQRRAAKRTELQGLLRQAVSAGARA